MTYCIDYFKFIKNKFYSDGEKQIGKNGSSQIVVPFEKNKLFERVAKAKERRK